MLLPCEIIVNYLLPAVRSRTIRILSKKHGFTQVQIAEALGLTQAAVSKHLSFKYTDKINKISKEKEVEKIADKLAKKVADGAGKDEVIESICKGCITLKSKGLIKKINKEFAS